MGGVVLRAFPDGRSLIEQASVTVAMLDLITNEVNTYGAEQRN